jgi:hypothetical protein
MIVRATWAKAPAAASEAVVAVAAIALFAVTVISLRLRSAAAGDEGRQFGIALFFVALPVTLEIRLRLRLILRLVLRLRLLLRTVRLLVRRGLKRLTVRLVLSGLVAVVVIVVAAFHVGTLERLLLLVRILLRELDLRRHDHSEIMFGVLQISFGRDRIAGRLRVARKLCVFFGDVMRGAADFYVGTVRFIYPRHWIVTAPVPSAHAIFIIVVVLSVSHLIQSLSLRGAAALLTNDCFPRFRRGAQKYFPRPFRPHRCPMHFLRRSYVRVFSNLETNSAFYADFLPSPFVLRPKPRATIGEALDPDVLAGGEIA